MHARPAAGLHAGTRLHAVNVEQPEHRVVRPAAARDVVGVARRCSG